MKFKHIRNLLIGMIIVGIFVAGGAILYLNVKGGDGKVSQDISEVSETIEAAPNAIVFSIIPEESEVSFTLEEDLEGIHTTVVGKTRQVGGEVAINFDTPSMSNISTITINARSLETDNNFRNQAIRADILRSAQDQYEFITFMPTLLTGLPNSIEIGETYTFSIIGNLTILDTTSEVTFTSDVTVVSSNEITGLANTTIRYGDWGVPVPSSPIIANVTENADLTITFVARITE